MRAFVLCLLCVGCGRPDADDVGTDDVLDDTDVGQVEPRDELRGVVGCASGDPTVRESDGDVIVETAHYRLTVRGGAVDKAEAKVLGALSEAGWDAWGTYFGDLPAPTDKYEAILTADRAGFNAAILADGDTPPADAGGYFSYVSGRAYLFAQPTRYYTRVLLLHELTHQAHLATRTTEEEVPAWFIEGVAEHLSVHDWDGESCVGLGVQALASLEDRMGAANAEAPANLAQLQGWLRDDTFPSRAALMGWWRFLDTSPGTRAAFSGWRADADAGSVSYGSLGTVVSTAEVFADYKAWLEDAVDPYAVVFLQWLPYDADSVQGWAAVSSAIRWKGGPPASFQVKHEVPGASGFAGVLVSYDDPTHNTSVMINATGEVRALVVNGADARWDAVGKVARPKKSVSWGVTWDGSVPTVQVGDATFEITTTSAPAAGLGLYDADLRFDEIGVVPAL